MITIISNIAVFAGALAMLLITGERHRRMGLWIGLLAQPAWFYLTITNQDWGMLGGTVLYTIAMIRGLVGSKS